MQRARTLAGLLLIAGIILAALVLQRAQRKERAHGAPDAQEQQIESPSPLLSSAALPEQTRSQVRKLAPEGTADGVPRGATPAAAKSGDSDEDFVLEVVDDASQTPVPDAEVRYEAREEPWASAAGCVYERLAGSGTITRTDARGIARLRVPCTMGVQVLVRHGGDVGDGSFGAPKTGEAGERRARVALRPDGDLEVEVVDEALRGVADIPVSCGVPGWSTKETTNEQGRARFLHVGHELGRTPFGQLRLSADLLLREPVEALVSAAPPPGEPVRLHLPQLGSVEISVFAPDGSPAEDGTRVCMTGVGAGAERIEAWGSPTVGESTSGGRACFPAVGLGFELELTAERAQEHAQVHVSGPLVPRERVKASLRLAVDEAVLLFRALDEQGIPLQGKLYVTIRDPARRLTTGHGWQVTADGDGRFEVELEDPGIAQAREIEVAVRELALSARVALNPTYPPERIEMGDVVLTPLPLIASGRVVDERGAALAQAVVFASVPYELPFDGRRSFRSVDDAKTTTDAFGAFALRGVIDGQRLRVNLGYGPRCADPLDVLVGATGLELVARETGGVAGRVLVEPGLAGCLRLRLRPDGQPEASPIWPEPKPRAASQVEEGSFSFERLFPGRYTLAVAIGRDELLAEIHGIAVTAAEVSHDPRVQELDLRGRLHVFTLDFLPPSPSFPLGGGFGYTAAGTSAPEFTSGIGPARRGPVLGVRVVTPLPRIDLRVHLEGCRVERFFDLEPHTEVHLRAGYPVRLALPANVELPSPPLYLGVELRGVADPSLSSALAMFDEHGEARLIAPEPARMRVVWTVERRSRDSTSAGALALAPERSFEVLDRDEEQRFVLQVTNDELQAALAAR